MNILLESSDSVPFYTDMRATLKAMAVEASSYDWFVSDVETNIPVPVLIEGDGWLSGDELSRALADDIQFEWAVFSAMPRGTRFDVLLSPSADGNARFWQPPDVQPQLQGAVFEIVCWDSSATLFIGISQQQAERVTAAYPEAKPLSSAWPKAEA
ncbi:hypothetical protein [Polaromonas sp. LjRoot131]|uniref:hypothetical protein n=1 Tax=Polaromonas sp. LjRoot131 TaxID=3342262 RepID=UPI003ED0FE7D